MTDFTEFVKLLTAPVSLLTALVGLSKALKQGSKPTPSLRRWPNSSKQRLCPALYNLGCRRHHSTRLTLLLSMHRVKNPRQCSWLQNSPTNSGY